MAVLTFSRSCSTNIKFHQRAYRWHSTTVVYCKYAVKYILIPSTRCINASWTCANISSALVLCQLVIAPNQCVEGCGRIQDGDIWGKQVEDKEERVGQDCKAHLHWILNVHVSLLAPHQYPWVCTSSRTFAELSSPIAGLLLLTCEKGNSTLHPSSHWWKAAVLMILQQPFWCRSSPGVTDTLGVGWKFVAF